METAFWETSALVPLCIPKQASALLHQFAHRHPPVVWWATSVEAQSAFARQLREGELSAEEHAHALKQLGVLKRKWREVQPSDSLRVLAGELVERYPLRAADALQLAAAYTWSAHRPFNRHLISGDKRLIGAAQSIGFRVIQIP